jgi:hypothetical protein
MIRIQFELQPYKPNLNKTRLGMPVAALGSTVEVLSLLLRFDKLPLFG